MDLENMPIEELRRLAEEKKASGLDSMPIGELRRLAQEKKEVQNSKGQGQAFLESFGKGATLGYLPQIQSAVAPAFEAVMGDSTTEDLEAQGFDVQEKDGDYISRRDENLARQKQQSENFPKTTMAGEAIGTIATAPLAPQVKGATLGAKALSGMKSAGIYGAIMNPSDTKGEFGGAQVIDRFENALTSALVGGATPYAGKALGKGANIIKGAGKSIKQASRVQALRAAGAERGSLKKVFKANRINIDEVADNLFKRREALGKEAIIMPNDTIEKIGSKIDIMVRDTGKRISDVTKYADEILDNTQLYDVDIKDVKKLRQSRISMKTFAKVMKRKLRRDLKGVEKEAYGKLSRSLDLLADEGENISLEALRKLRQGVDDKLSWTKAAKELTPLQNGYKEIRHKIQDITKQKLRYADEIHGTKLLDAFETANREFAQFKTLEEFATNKISAQMGNKLFGMSEMLFGLSGASGGGGGLTSVVAGLGMAGLSAGGRKYGASTGARILRRTAKVLQSDPARLGKFKDIIVSNLDKKPEDLAKILIQLNNNDKEFKEAIRSPRKNKYETSKNRKRNKSLYEKNGGKMSN